MKIFTCKKWVVLLLGSLVFSMGALAAAPSPNSFIITVKTDNAGESNNNQFTIPTTGTDQSQR